MATPVKVSARNNITALKDARKFHHLAISKVDHVLAEVERMQESTGRPDYGRLKGLLGEMALNLSKVTRPLEEMMVIRAEAGHTVEDDLAERLAAVEAELAELRHTLNVKEERLFPL